MAKAKNYKRTPIRRRQKKAARIDLGKHTVTPDALFTIVLSCEAFIADKMKQGGVKINANILREGLTEAVLDGIYATATTPIYNVAADALAAAYLANSRGETDNAMKMVQLAFQSPDCNSLLSGLVELNKQAVSTKILSEDLEDGGQSENTGDVESDTPSLPDQDFDPVLDIQNTQNGTSVEGEEEEMIEGNKPDDATQNIDFTGGGSGGEGLSYEDTEGKNDDGATAIMNASKFSRKVRKLIRQQAGADDYAIKYGIDGVQGLSDELGVDVADPDELLEVETLGDTNFNIPDTMRLGAPQDINEIRGEYPDNLAKIEPLTAKQLESLSRKNPNLVKIANKLALQGGERAGHHFLRRAMAG
jgi:hypothetical protein